MVNNCSHIWSWLILVNYLVSLTLQQWSVIIVDHRRSWSTQSLSRRALLPFLDVSEMLNIKIKTEAMMYIIYTLLFKGT